MKKMAKNFHILKKTGREMVDGNGKTGLNRLLTGSSYLVGLHLGG